MALEEEEAKVLLASAEQRFLLHGKGFIEAALDIAKYWKAAGYSTLTEYLDARPDVARMFKEVSDIIPIRQPLVKQLTEEGKSQAHIAKRVGKSERQVSLDQRAVGVKPAGVKHTPRRQLNPKSLGVPGSESNPELELPITTPPKPSWDRPSKTDTKADLEKRETRRLVKLIEGLEELSYDAIRQMRIITSEQRGHVRAMVPDAALGHIRDNAQFLHDLLHAPDVDWDAEFRRILDEEQE